LATGLVAVGTAIALSLTALATVAFADSSTGKTDKTGSGALEYSWDDETFVLDWENTPRKVARADTEFLGTLTAVPGDQIYRSLQVRNAGPSSATLSLFFRGWESQPAVGSAGNELTEASRLFWTLGETTGRVNFSKAVEQDEYLAAEVKLEKGEQIKIRVGWELPYETKTGNGLAGSQQLSFGIRLLLSEFPEVDTPAIADQPAGESGKGSPGQLPFTGADTIGVLVLSALSTLAGVLLLLLIRRRRKTDEDDHPPNEAEAPLQRS
jgi:LPXTG-motif cell wall-anchored protein